MSFFARTSSKGFRSTKQVKPVSTKWVDHSREAREQAKAERRRNGIGKALGKGRKGIFWDFCKLVWELYVVKIGLKKECEIKSDFCDNYWLTPAHIQRREDTRVGDYWNALRVLVACTECHTWADFYQEGRTNSTALLETYWQARNERLGMTDDDAKRILLECAGEILAEDALKEVPRFAHFHIEF